MIHSMPFYSLGRARLRGGSSGRQPSSATRELPSANAQQLHQLLVSLSAQKDDLLFSACLDMSICIPGFKITWQLPKYLPSCKWQVLGEKSCVYTAE